MKLFFLVLVSALIFLPACNRSKHLTKEEQVLLINIKEFGAKGDGLTDDWEVIQRAVDKLASLGGGTLYFPKGTYTIFDKSIVVWGSNINLIGEELNNTTIIKKGATGYFGDCIDIAGKINKYQYYGLFGKGDYKKRQIYDGSTEKVSNIRLENLIIDSDLNDVNTKIIKANGLGILNASKIHVRNCIIKNSPQTNVGIVNDTELFQNEDISFSNCQFINSGQHNVRVISYNDGKFLGNHISFDSCQFLDVRGVDQSAKELFDIGKPVHLWYRGSRYSGKSKIRIRNSTFDSTGIIYANANVNGLSIINSEIAGYMIIQHSTKLEIKPSILIESSSFSLKDIGADVKSKKGYKSTSFGIVSPETLEISVK